MNGFVFAILFAVALCLLLIQTRNVLFAGVLVIARNMLGNALNEYDAHHIADAIIDGLERLSAEDTKEVIEKLEEEWKYADDPKWIEVREIVLERL